MGALLQNPFTMASRVLKVTEVQNATKISKMNKRCLICCQSNSNVTKGDKFSASAMINSSVHGAAVKDSSIVLSPNGKSPAELAVKELFPYHGGSLVQVEKGIGIVKFLRGKTLFVTGATGFLAKVFIEKLLRTVPDVGKIYVLIKAKDQESAVHRLRNEILNAEIFKCLLQKYGKSYEDFMMSKLIPVVGNICESDLGLDEDSTSRILEDVDIIINSAANTNFHERYDAAIDINTRGPGRVMSLAKKCKKLKLFLQVSTAYVNGQRRGRILERPFRIGEIIAGESFESENQTSLIPFLDVEEEISIALNLCEALEDQKAAQRMKELGLERARKYGWQDTYVFTKAMGEMLLGSMRGDVPVVILRPSIIESTHNDPFPGWIEGNRMMDPIVTYYGKGQLSGFLVDPNAVIDVVPVDMVVNVMLTAMAKHGIDRKPEVTVYQVASSVKNPLVNHHLGDLLYKHFSRLPWLDSNGFPIKVEKFKYYSSMEGFSSDIWKETVRHLRSLPASNGHSSGGKLEKVCRKVVEQAKSLASMYQPYCFYGGRFDSTCTQSLFEIMSDEERRMFHFDVGSIDWQDYISNIHIPGLRRHVMKGRGLNF